VLHFRPWRNDLVDAANPSYGPLPR